MFWKCKSHCCILFFFRCQEYIAITVNRSRRTGRYMYFQVHAEPGMRDSDTGSNSHMSQTLPFRNSSRPVSFSLATYFSLLPFPSWPPSPLPPKKTATSCPLFFPLFLVNFLWSLFGPPHGFTKPAFHCFFSRIHSIILNFHCPKTSHNYLRSFLRIYSSWQRKSPLVGMWLPLPVRW